MQILALAANSEYYSIFDLVKLRLAAMPVLSKLKRDMSLNQEKAFLQPDIIRFRF
jgi:hypothetical protein